RPEMLRSLWAALGDDPLAVAETLARPVLAERLARSFQASDPRFEGQTFEAWWARVGSSQSTQLAVPTFAYHLPALTPSQLGTWSPTHALPEADLLTSSV